MDRVLLRGRCPFDLPGRESFSQASRQLRAGEAPLHPHSAERKMIPKRRVRGKQLTCSGDWIVNLTKFKGEDGRTGKLSY